MDNLLKVPVLSMDGKSHRVFLGTQSRWFNIEVTGKNTANTNHRDDMWDEWVQIRVYVWLISQGIQVWNQVTFSCCRNLKNCISWCLIPWNCLFATKALYQFDWGKFLWLTSVWLTVSRDWKITFILINYLWDVFCYAKLNFCLKITFDTAWILCHWHKNENKGFHAVHV